MRTVAPAQHYSKIVEFAKEVAEEASDDTPTSVEIFSDGGHWYCRVRRGDEKTRPMGPYTKRQAEEIQDARRKLIAKMGSARLIFEATRKG
ncbi:hypothetical protein EN935_33775 [Mesorhizobium sp. M7D.F.Ca.US.004.03.1.1]|uniref:hypothetical protein n=1 Tax=Mesorhizobium sp. M7D.F.Ca.US.004.03.1.1 TaxID=2496702 RepID=UPI000FCB1B7A|nr:hypothetical protein [Mesorhizobium sp. M7D.F.Ca.US.004.03.1.1]RVA20409.1 hypothetical protein EN935_33775 [Mesorhizobium sp. M7D.F.Ca.US.004.03.1.1]